MTIYSQQRQPVATTHTTATGREFLFGNVPRFNIPGHHVTISPDRFVAVSSGVHCYFVEDGGDDWLLSEAVAHGPGDWCVLDKPPVRVAKNPEAGA